MGQPRGMCRRYLYSLATDKERGFIAGILKIFLLLLSIIYSLIVRILSLLYRLKPYQLNCKVISVGNITLGGTGKTSLVEFIAQYLKQQGHKISILSRGYGRYRTQTANRKPNHQIMGDEPYMLGRNLGNVPVIVDEDRVRSAQNSIRDHGVDTVILDDGFQQWRIKKDLDIVTIDATNPLGNLHLLPRGILRESPSSLKRANIFVLTKVNLNPDNQKIKGFLNRINPDALIVEAIHKPVGLYKLGGSRYNLMDPESFQGNRVSLFSGIADPQSFEDLVNNLGIKIGLVYRFPDHYIYRAEDFNKIISDSKQEGISIIITTEKDSVRFPTTNYELLTMNCFVLRIKLEILQNEIFIKRIHSLY